MPDRKTSANSYKIKLVLVLVLCIVGALAAQLWISEGKWQSAVEHLATAGIIASVLGLTIDIWLKKQITEDVFNAAMGYELPEDLRKEIRAVYGNRVLCEAHEQTVDIVDLGNGFVSVTIGTERTFRNIAETPQELRVGLATDEWDVPDHPTKIHELSYVQDGKETIVYPNGVGTYTDRPIGPKIELPKPLVLKPQETVKVCARLTEARPVNGDHWYNFTYPTLRPRVTVRADGFKSSVHFAHREQPEVSKYSGTAYLDGLLLQNQCIRVRWLKDDQDRPV